MAPPSLADALNWIIAYPRMYGGVGVAAVAGGMSAAYYMYGSPMQAWEFGAYGQLAQGYALGAAVSTASVYVLKDIDSSAQYVPDPQ